MVVFAVFVCGCICRRTVNITWSNIVGFEIDIVLELYTNVKSRLSAYTSTVVIFLIYQWGYMNIIPFSNKPFDFSNT